MNKQIEYLDLKQIDYLEAWDKQKELFNSILNIKAQNRKASAEEQQETNNYLLFCEHPHVYTLGKNGSEQNMLLNMIQLQAKHASFHKIERGGDITYHGPGQITGYPIFDLENFGMGPRKYIELMEDVIIESIAEFGIKGERLEGATGVWIDAQKPGKARKICAIGVKMSRFVSMHGFALNVNTDLKYFDYINPCGFTDKSVTSIEKECGQPQDFEAVKQVVKNKFVSLFC